MGNIFDELGGMVQGAEQKVGDFLGNMFPTNNAPSQPAKPQLPPLPQNPPSQAPNPIGSPLAGMSPRPVNSDVGGSKLGDFFQGTGVTDLWKNFMSPDTKNPNTFAGQVADPNSAVNQAGQNFSIPVVSGAAKYVSNVLNAGVVDPIHLASDPQMWFADDSNQSNEPLSVKSSPLDPIMLWNNVGGGHGHNYLRDVFAPTIKQLTGEDVPPSTWDFQPVAQRLSQQGQQLQQARDILGPDSSPADIAAYNAKLDEYNSQVSQYKQMYDKSQDWWTNSNIAKTLSAIGQIATTPGQFYTAGLSFAPNMIADPIGTGESTIQQFQMAGNFVQKLMDPEARQKMSFQEVESNLSNVVMLSGMLYGGKKTAAKTFEVGKSILGRKPDQAALDEVIQRLHDNTPEHNIPEPSPAVKMSPVDVTSRSQVRAHSEQLYQDATRIREAMTTSKTPAEREVLQKQLNDITDQITNIRNQPKPVGVLNRNQQLGRDIGQEKVNEQRPQYTKPVYPQGGFPDSQVETMLHDLPDFTQHGIQQQAMAKFPDRYASASSTEAPPSPHFEDMAPQTIEQMARDQGHEVVPINKVTGNAWLNPRSNNAIMFKANMLEDLRNTNTSHAEFIDSMRHPGDVRDNDQVVSDMLAAGWVKVSDFGMMKSYVVDMLDPENLSSIQKAIEADLEQTYEQGKPRQYPYEVMEVASGKTHSITPQEFAANKFNLAKTLQAQGRRTSANSTTAPPPDKLSSTQIVQTLADLKWKYVPFKNIDYGWLFPEGKGANLGLSGDRRGDHEEMWSALERTLGRSLTSNEYQDLQKQNNMVQLRRGYGANINDYYFYAEEWNPKTVKMVEDYMLGRSGQRPENITIETRGKHGLAGTLSDITWEDFKDNDFRLDGLMRGQVRADFGHTNNLPRMFQDTANEGPWLHDKFVALNKVRNQLNFLEDRILRDTAAGKNSRKDEVQVKTILEDAQKTIENLPEDVPPHLAKIRDEIRNKLNEKGYTASLATGPESTSSQTGEGHNAAPAGAPEGSTLTTVIKNPEGQAPVAVWSPDAKSPRTISSFERGRLELEKDVRQKVAAARATDPEAGIPASLRNVNSHPANIARRINEFTAVAQAKMADIDPFHVATINHIVYDTNLPSEANFDPSTGMLTINPSRGLPEDWIRGLGFSMGRALDTWKMEGKPLSVHQLQYAKNYIDETLTAPQSERDFAAIAEEVFHKYDTDYYTIGEYFNALLTLPQEWWDHAMRTGLGDVMPEGIQYYHRERGWVSLVTREGFPVHSWVEGFIKGTQDRLDDDSVDAVFTTFVEFRVKQLLNYHGVRAGSGYNYRIPEVFYREFENPDLIAEGARIGGETFEGYVKANTATRLAQPVPPEEAALSQRAAERGPDATIGSDATNDASAAPAVSNAPAVGDRGRRPGDKGSVDYPRVGDILQVNLAEEGQPPQWQNFFNGPIKDDAEARMASRVVATRGRSDIYSTSKLDREYRVVTKTGQPRVFQGGIPEPQPESAPATTGSGTPIAREFPEGFHGIPTPEPPPVDLEGKLAPPKRQRVPAASYEKAPPRTVGSAAMFKPIDELKKTGYPGNWEDFLTGLANPENETAHNTSLEYWNKMSPRSQRAWMDTLKEPGVQRAYINREPTVGGASEAEVNSPSFQARQAQIAQFRQDIEKSGPMLDRLRKSANTKKGFDDYARLKAMTAAKIKYSELAPGIPELEAKQLMGQEYSRVWSELNGEKESAVLPDRVKLQKSTNDLTRELQPVIRNYIASRVTMKDSKSGQTAKGYFSSLDRFVDAYAGGDENAKRVYATLPKTAKQAIRNIVEQMPKSLQLPGRMRSDQSSIPESQQSSQEHINPSPAENIKALVETASRNLVRHGSTEYNERGLIRSHDDPPLSSLGRLQARNIGRAFNGMRNLKVVSHDLERAKSTAFEIAKSARGSKVSVDAELRPWNVGEQLRGASVTAGNPLMRKWMFDEPDFVPDGGESFNQFKVRFLNALRNHIFDKDVLVMSTRNLRMAEDWIEQGMPQSEYFEPGNAMRTVREVGPGGVLALTHQKDGTFTVHGKMSQKENTSENLFVPKIKSEVSQRPEKVTVKRTPEPVQKIQIPQTVQEQVKINIKIGEVAKNKAANIKGEVIPPIEGDINDQIDAVVADPSILATDPLKTAAIEAKLAHDEVSIARQVDVPPQEVKIREEKYSQRVRDFSAKAAEKAVQSEKAAPATARVPKNKLIFDVSTKKAKDHLERVKKGVDYGVSAAQAAREIGVFDRKNPLGDALRVMKDLSQSLLPSDHLAYSLSPAFKDIFVNPKALELIKNENASEAPKQGILPLSPEISIGAHLPDPAPIDSKSRRPDVVRVRKPVNPVVPAEVENLVAHSPRPEEPEEVHPREAAKTYKIKIGDRGKMSTTQLRDETQQTHAKVNTPSPDLFVEDELEAENEAERNDYDAATHGSPPKPSEAVKVAKTNQSAGGRGGGKGKPPFEPLRGWDDARDKAMSIGGDMKSLSLRYDYALKMMTNLLDPSINTAHPKGMANAFLNARTEAIYVGDEIHQLLKKLLPMNNADDLVRHQNIAKAVGGDNEADRKQALDKLSDQDVALANMFDAYHKVMGQLGVKAEHHLWDEAQENYFPRRVLFDENGKAPTDVHGNTQWSKKMDIARPRRKSKEVTGFDDNGNPMIRQVNYYKDNEDLKSKGFKVEENVGNLQKYHWDAFSNMMLTHQFIKVLSHLDTYDETAIKSHTLNIAGKQVDLGLGDKAIGTHGLPKGVEPYHGRILVPTSESVAGKVRATQIARKYKDQLTHVTKGPFSNALAHYWVYKPVAEQIERMTSSKASDNMGEQVANLFSQANNTFKIFKFGFNPIHLYNLLSNVYTLGTKGLLDSATYNPMSLHHRIYGRTEALLQDKTTYKDWNGEDIVGKDMIAKIMRWGGVLPKDIIDVANLGGLTGVLSRNVPGFKAWHNFMWQNVAWKGQIGLTLHLLDVMRNEMEKPGALGRQLNEQEFENAGKLATRMSNYAMGFLSKQEMTRDWQVYGNALFLANSWSLAQMRMLGLSLPKNLPGRDFLANIGGGETYNDIVTEQMKSMGGMTQEGLNAINGYQGKIARKLMVGGAAKLLATSTVLAYIGSYFGNQGQAQGPLQNFQRDPTHTFDIYLGNDPQTHKDNWAHNPLFGMQQEMLLYGLQAMKEHSQGGNPYDILSSVAGRVINKMNPIMATSLDIAINRNLSLYLQGYGDRSDISADPNVIAIRRALDATGKNPFPDSFTNNFIYAVRTLFPSPGFPESLDTSGGTNPTMTNATAGNVLNALGPGKVLGIGDIINAVQSGDNSALLKKDLGGLAQWLTGSRITTTSTPEQILTNNNISSSIATRDQRNQAIGDMVQLFTAGQYAQAAQIASQLNLPNSQLIEALQHPPAGSNSGPGVLYAGLPNNQGAAKPQDTLNGVLLNTDQTSELESLKGAHSIALLAQITKLPEFQSANQTERAAMISSYTSLVNGMVSDQYAQQIGLIGGTAISNQDIEGAVNTAIEFRNTANSVLSGMNIYSQADPLEQQRMRTTFDSYAITLAKNAYNGDLKGVPIDTVKQILTYTINAEETSRSFVENSMYYQIAAPGDQQRMISEYSNLARTMARREALGEGQGSYAFQIPQNKVIPTIEFIMNVEELGKAELHGTEFYNAASPTDQASLDGKIERMSRGLAFSTSGADPRQLIRNMLTSQQQFFDLQNEFGGSTYVKLMAQQLSDLERQARVDSELSPKQINTLERAIRSQFLSHNPAYAEWLKTKAAWQKYTPDGQTYQAVNNSEYSAVADMQTAGVIPSDLYTSSQLDAGAPLDPSADLQDPSLGDLGLPSIDYNTFNAQNG